MLLWVHTGPPYRTLPVYSLHGWLPPPAPLVPSRDLAASTRSDPVCLAPLQTRRTLGQRCAALIFTARPNPVLSHWPTLGVPWARVTARRLSHLYGWSVPSYRMRPVAIGPPQPAQPADPAGLGTSANLFCCQMTIWPKLRLHQWAATCTAPSCTRFSFLAWPRLHWRSSGVPPAHVRCVSDAPSVVRMHEALLCTSE